MRFCTGQAQEKLLGGLLAKELCRQAREAFAAHAAAVMPAAFLAQQDADAQVKVCWPLCGSEPMQCLVQHVPRTQACVVLKLPERYLHGRLRRCRVRAALAVAPQRPCCAAGTVGWRLV